MQRYKSSPVQSVMRHPELSAPTRCIPPLVATWAQQAGLVLAEKLVSASRTRAST
jgi:hypothetical protein